MKKFFLFAALVAATTLHGAAKRKAASPPSTASRHSATTPQPGGAKKKTSPLIKWSDQKKSCAANKVQAIGFTGGWLSMADAGGQWAMDVKQMSSLSSGNYDATLNNRGLQTFLIFVQAFLRVGTCVMSLAHKGKKNNAGVVTAQAIAILFALAELCFRMKAQFVDLTLNDSDRSALKAAIQSGKIDPTLFKWVVTIMGTLRGLLRLFRGKLEEYNWRKGSDAFVHAKSNKTAYFHAGLNTLESLIGTFGVTLQEVLFVNKAINKGMGLGQLGTHGPGTIS